MLLLWLCSIGHHHIQLSVLVTIELEVWRSVRSFIQQHRQALIPILLHLIHGQIVLFAPEWRLELQRDEVDAPQKEYYHERDRCGYSSMPIIVAEVIAACHRSVYPMKQQHDHTRLRIGEWERKVCDLPRILQIHDASRNLLEGSRQHWRSYRNDTRLHVDNSRALDPLQDDFDFVDSVVEEFQTRSVNAVQFDYFECSIFAGRHLLKPATEEQAHQTS
mmetsp:Transcript_34622/g.55117  ORF Transcript_34622/g.55117 Transcript_34622/m.55117 type:complete len:219 (+) Transcript_34622:549-1205(+)